MDEELLLLDVSGDPASIGRAGELLWDQQSPEGSLSLDSAEQLVRALTLHTQSPAVCWFAIWEGWGDRRPRQRSAPTFAVPQRVLHLFEGQIDDALRTFDLEDCIFGSANMWWPDDRACRVPTEVDFKWTHVGASSRCIRRLLGDPSLEASKLLSRQFDRLIHWRTRAAATC